MSEALFALIHRPGPAWQDGVGYREQPGIERHVAYMRSLFDQGRMPMGGPFLDDSGGMMLLEADSLDEATAVARADPTVGEGLLCVDVRQWRLVFRRDGSNDAFSSPATAPAG